MTEEQMEIIIACQLRTQLMILEGERKGEMVDAPFALKTARQWIAQTRHAQSVK